MIFIAKRGQIFLYGGGATATDTGGKTDLLSNTDLAQVWVLSLPSFTWYQSTYTPQKSRYSHTCQVPGNPPRRHMLVIGGGVPNLDNNVESVDDFPQGFGVFDLTEMQWKKSYNSSAETYITPQIVKAGIAANGTYPQIWDNPNTALWLTGKCRHSSAPSNSWNLTDFDSAGQPFEQQFIDINEYGLRVGE